MLYGTAVVPVFSMFCVQDAFARLRGLLIVDAKILVHAKCELFFSFTFCYISSFRVKIDGLAITILEAIREEKKD